MSRRQPPLSKSPPKIQQLRQPLLQRNRTQSEASYEGNTIDMVRIVRKNQQSRHSLINIDHREYLKPQQSLGHQWRHSETHQNNHKAQGYKEEDQQPQLSSTFVHQGTDFFYQQNPQLIEHYIRPSNVNILSSMNQQGNNKVLGLTLFCVFLALFSLETLVCSYFLNACHVVFGHFDYILKLNYEYYDEVFEEIEKRNLITILALYLGVECLYHTTILAINSYTEGRYRLIDKETARLSYILKCRDFNRNSHSQVQKLIRSPRFTILLILLATLLQSYGIVRCYYYNELNLMYVYFMSSKMVGLIEIFYFSVLLPDIWNHLFFEKMHSQNRQVSESRESQSQQWKLPPLTNFTIEHWWIKLALVMLFLSVIYSLIVSPWLILVSFAKIEISFQRMKHKIDTFYLQFIGKLILLGVVLLVIYLRTLSLFLLTIQYSFECLVVITLGLLLSRVLANLFLRRELYKYFYSQMNINIGNVLFAFVIVYVVNVWMDQVEYLSVSVIAVLMLCIGLTVSLYAEENHRLVINFTEDNPNSEVLVEMKHI